MTTKTFREICNNDPAIAIKALTDSLSNQKRIPWLTLDFDDYHNVVQGHCYGCAAIFTMLSLHQETSVIPPIPNEIFDDEEELANYLGHSIRKIKKLLLCNQ